MVWGAFSYDHVLQLKGIDGAMNAVNYRDAILEPIVRPFLESPNGQSISFQDYNARPYRARVIDDYKNLHIRSILWSSLSPDLNPIEHQWDQLGRRIYRHEHPVLNLRQLEQAILQEWDQIPDLGIKFWWRPCLNGVLKSFRIMEDIPIIRQPLETA